MMHQGRVVVLDVAGYYAVIVDGGADRLLGLCPVESVDLAIGCADEGGNALGGVTIVAGHSPLVIYGACRCIQPASIEGGDRTVWRTHKPMAVPGTIGTSHRTMFADGIRHGIDCAGNIYGDVGGCVRAGKCKRACTCAEAKRQKRFFLHRRMASGNLVMKKISEKL